MSESPAPFFSCAAINTLSLSSRSGFPKAPCEHGWKLPELVLPLSTSFACDRREETRFLEGLENEPGGERLPEKVVQRAVIEVVRRRFVASPNGPTASSAEVPSELESVEARDGSVTIFLFHDTDRARGVENGMRGHKNESPSVTK